MLQCPSLEALVAEVVAAQVDVCNALVGSKGFGEGLHSWRDAHCQVDSRPVGVSRQLCCYALSIGILACPAQTWTRDRPKLSTWAQHDSCQILMSASSPFTIEHICMVICFHLVSAVYHEATHSNNCLMPRHSAISFPIRKKDRAPEGVVYLKQVETSKWKIDCQVTAQKASKCSI